MRERHFPSSLAGRPVPIVTVGMPVRNECGSIRTALLSILSQDYPNWAFGILVVDGASDDGTPDIIEALAVEHPQIRWIYNFERIVATALNAGIECAGGEIIVRMDAHTVYAPDYVTQCVVLLLHTGADNVGGAWVPRGTNPFSRAVAAAYQSPIGSGGARAHQPSYEGWADTVYLGSEFTDKLLKP
jgi:succinoglycan biosynthesis protein ExoA